MGWKRKDDITIRSAAYRSLELCKVLVLDYCSSRHDWRLVYK
jgi:hypothetical protein